MEARSRINSDRTTLTAGLVVLVYLLGDVLLLVFGGVLLAVGLDGMARTVSDRLPVSRGWTLVGITIGFAALLITTLGLSATRLIEQFRELIETMIAFLQTVHTRLLELGALDFLSAMDGEGEGFAGVAANLAGEAMNWGTKVVGAITSLGIIVVLTLFLAARPEFYRQGAVRLVPPDQRELVNRTLSAIAHALRRWFLGQLISMVFLGWRSGSVFWFSVLISGLGLRFWPHSSPLVRSSRLCRS